MITQSAWARQPIREAWSEEHLFLEHSIALGLVIKSSTSTAYDSHLNSFINFCQLHHCMIDPTADTLSYYVVWLSHYIEPRLVDTYLSGIANKLEFMFPDMHAARRSPLVTQTLQGCKRQFSKPIRQKLPIGEHDIVCIIQSIGILPDYDNALFIAMLMTGFKTLQHLGELAWPDSVKFQSYRKVAMCHTLIQTPTTISYTLPYQKNDSLRSGYKILLCISPKLNLDSLGHMQFYLTLHDAKHLHHPALWVTESGTVPTHSWFLCKLHLFGGQEFTGYSMRAGGATALAAAGMSGDLI
jgi:hypothetical protein